MLKAKGNLVVGQSGGPTAVINCSLVGVIEESRSRSEIGSVLGLVNGVQGALNETFIDLGSQPRTVLDGLLQTPASALGSCRLKLAPPDYERIYQVFRAHNVRYFLYIGGNDSMDTALQVEALARLKNYDLQVIGIPKTIDNDLECTHHCPGYGSAARYIAHTVLDTAADLRAMRTFMQVYVLEVMGRNAGWLAAAASLANRPNKDLPLVLCLPEEPFDPARFLARVAEVQKAFGCVLVVASQGIRVASDEAAPNSGSAIATDSFGHKIGFGVGNYLTGLIRAELGFTCRWDMPGSIQRASMACVSNVDQMEAREVGRAAVRRVAEGKSGYMVTLERSPDSPYECTTSIAKLSDVANRERLLPSEFIGTFGVTPAFRAYAEPLLGASLPGHACLEPLLIPSKEPR